MGIKLWMNRCYFGEDVIDTVWLLISQFNLSDGYCALALGIYISN